MLKKANIYITVIVVLVLSTTISCKKRSVPTIELIEVEPSYTQTLTITNHSQDTVTILPTPSSQVKSILIPTNNSKDIQFTVVRMAQLDQMGKPITATWTARINREPTYIGMENTDGLLQIRTVDGEVWNYLISIGECWFSDNPPIEEHELKIGNEEPIFGIPAVRLCD